MKRMISFFLSVLLWVPIVANAGTQIWDRYELMDFYYSIPRGWILKNPHGLSNHEYYIAGEGELQEGVLYLGIYDIPKILEADPQEEQYESLEDLFAEMFQSSRIVDAAQRIMINGSYGIAGRVEAIEKKTTYNEALVIMDGHIVTLSVALPHAAPEKQDSLVEQVMLSIYPKHSAEKFDDPVAKAEALEAIWAAALYRDPELAAAYDRIKQILGQHVDARRSAAGAPADKTAAWEIIKSVFVYRDQKPVFEDVVTFDDGAQIAVLLGQSSETGMYQGKVLFEFDGSDPYLEGVRIFRCAYIIQEAIVASNGHSEISCIGYSGEDSVFIVFSSDEEGASDDSLVPDSYLSVQPSAIDPDLIMATKNFINIQIGVALRNTLP